MSENSKVGYSERTYRLREKDGRFAWIFDDNGEIHKGQTFDTRTEAEEWLRQFPETWVSIEKFDPVPHRDADKAPSALEHGTPRQLP